MYAEWLVQLHGGIHGHGQLYVQPDDTIFSPYFKVAITDIRWKTVVYFRT